MTATITTGEPQAKTSNIVWQCQPANNNYELVIEKINHNGKVYYWGNLYRNTLLAESNGLLEGFEQARSALVARYHRRAEDLTEMITEVSPDLLGVHPHNYSIYQKRDNSRLKEQIATSRKVYRLTATLDGIVTDGNRRLEVVAELNREAFNQGLELPYPTIEVEFKHYENHEEEIDELVRKNQYRESKSEEELYKEIAILIEAEKAKAEKRMRSGQKVDASEKGKVMDRVAKHYGDATGIQVSGKTVTDRMVSHSYISQLRDNGREEFANTFEKLRPKKTPNAMNDLMALDDRPDLQEKVAQRMLATDKNKSVKHFVDEIALEEVAQKAQKVNSEEKVKDLLTLALALPETICKASDDWHSTPEQIEMMTMYFAPSGIDLDPTSDLFKKNIPARKHYNILDDGLTKDWEGNIATNMPFSKSTEFMKAWDRSICSGKCKEALVIAKSGILHNKTAQPILSKHRMGACIFRGRQGFIVGEILANKTDRDGKPSPFAGQAGIQKDDANIDIVVLQFGDRFAEFEAIYSKVGEIVRFGGQVATLAGDRHAMTPPSWDGDGELYETNWLNFTLTVAQDEDEQWTIGINGDYTEEVFDDEHKAKSMAMGLALSRFFQAQSSLAVNPFDALPM